MKKNLFQELVDNRKKYLTDLKKEKTTKGRIKKQIPNILTASRLFAPLFVIPATFIMGFEIGFYMIISFAITDAFDGFLARKWNAISDYGKTLDIISDKTFALGLSIPPLFTNPLLILPSLLLEGIISIICLNSGSKNNDPKSRKLGKFKTVILFSLYILFYFFKGHNISLTKLYSLIAITNLLQIATAIDYHKIDKKEDKIKENYYKKNETKENNGMSNIKKEILEYQNIKNMLLDSNIVEHDFVKTKRK